MNILIESKTLQDIDQKILWTDVQVYFEKNNRNDKKYFAIYAKALDTRSSNFIWRNDKMSDKEKGKLFDTAAVLNRISKMNERFKNIMALNDLFKLYNKCVDKGIFDSLRKKITAHLIHSVMAFHNPLLCLEEIYICKSKCNELLIEAPLTSMTFSDMIANLLSDAPKDEKNIIREARNLLLCLLEEFENNNMFRLVQMACTYCRLDNKGVFIPALMSFFSANGRTDIVKK
ncbi:hypothetical protein ENBRE01_0712 [Enteropsectra breve]|nr:hypothetical protein ENBRE01_0712 [Enteropsectra breve]